MLVYTAVAIPFLGAFSKWYRVLIGRPIRDYFFETPKKQKTKNQSLIQIMDHMEITLTVLQRFVNFYVTYYVIKMSNDKWVIFRQ